MFTTYIHIEIDSETIGDQSSLLAENKGNQYTGMGTIVVSQVRLYRTMGINWTIAIPQIISLLQKWKVSYEATSIFYRYIIIIAYHSSL